MAMCNSHIRQNKKLFMSMSKAEKAESKKMLRRYSEHEFVHKNDRAIFKKLLKNI